MGLRLPTLAEMRAVALLLTIALKDAGLGQWVLNPSQELVAGKLASGGRVLIFKLRQEGITSICMLWLLLLALFNPGLRFAIVLQDNVKAAEKLRDTLKKWLPQLGITDKMCPIWGANCIQLPNGAEIHALSARAGEAEGEETSFGRSGSFAAAILSEAGYYANDKAYPAIKAAVGKGPLVLESTVSGPEGFFADMAQRDDHSFEVVFLGVESSPRCQADPDSIDDERWRLLQEERGFTSRSHAAWWWAEFLDIGDVLSMLREYPVRPSDPFQVSSSMWVNATPSEIVALRYTDPLEVGIYAEPEPDRRKARYLLSVDVAEGVGGDWSVVWAIDRESHDIVAGWWSNTDETDELALRIREAWTLYRPELCIIERNGVGDSAIKAARRLKVPVVPEWADGSGKYDKLLNAKRYIEARPEVPLLLIEEAKSLRARPTRHDRYQWIGRKDGMIALGQALEWLKLNPWKPAPVLNEEERYVALSRASA